jgi:hypothetical protein
MIDTLKEFQGYMWAGLESWYNIYLVKEQGQSNGQPG